MSKEADLLGEETDDKHIDKCVIFVTSQRNKAE